VREGNIWLFPNEKSSSPEPQCIGSLGRKEGNKREEGERESTIRGRGGDKNEDERIK
jgi:hypothetical protein